jgi:2',3'-cyclic-nucleotide 2'-phosphodiesterase / 3'-nucleotidase / 5'-nucleotidase
MLPLLTVLALAAAPLQDTAQVVVVATTDIHGHATDWDYLKGRGFGGGLSRVATVVDSLKSRYPGQVVVVDGGDLLQGDPFATYFARIKPHDPHPVMEAMNLAGYDVATLGNHDFDWGLPALRRAVSAAAFPYVSGNIYTLASDTLLYPPFVVLQRQGVRIGVAGFTTPGVMLWNQDQIRGKVRVERIPSAASRVLESLRRQADLAIVVIHSGMDGPASFDTTGIGAEHAAASLATLPVRPDLVIVGHSHREMRDSVLGGVHFVQPKPFGGSVSVTHIQLTRVGERWQVDRVHGDLVSTASIPPSQRLVQRLTPAHRAVLAWVDTPIGEATASMPAAAARAEPTAVINFINAVQRKRTGAQLSATAAFNLDAGIDSGGVTVGQVVALYPYDNTLKAVRISGAQLKEYLEQSARYFRSDAVGRISLNDSIPGYNFDIVAGATYDIDLRRPVGDRIQNLRVRGRPVRPGDSFTLALNSYRQTGAGGYSMVRGAPVVYDKGENVRDLLLEEIRTRRRISPADFASREWRIIPEGIATSVKSLFRVRASPLPAAPTDIVVLRVLATTDLHGALLPKPDAQGNLRGGVANIAGMLDSLTRECGCSTLRLDAGDAIQGTVIANLTRGRAMVEALNRMSLGAAALGEHDLEWSLDTLRRRMSESRYPWLAANVFDSATGQRPDWITPYRIIEGGGLRVAVVGYITSDAKASLKPAATAGLRVGDGAIAIHDVLTEVRSRRPDLTILLAHAGALCEAAACRGEVIRLAEGLDPQSVDLIVAGHSDLVSTRVAGVPIISGGAKGSALAVADFVKTAAGGREVRARFEPVVPGEVPRDSAMAEVVEQYRQKADSLASRPVANVKFPLARADNQHRLGALIAEAWRNGLRADVGLVANSEIQADLPPGPVTYGQLFEILPSQNELVKVTVSGSRLQELLEQALGPDGRPLIQLAGLTVIYDPRRKGNQRIQEVELLGGRKLRRQEIYTLATDEFLSGGGAGITLLRGAPAEPGGMLDVDGLITYLQKLPQPVAFAGGSGFISSRP